MFQKRILSEEEKAAEERVTYVPNMLPYQYLFSGDRDGGYIRSSGLSDDYVFEASSGFFLKTGALEGDATYKKIVYSELSKNINTYPSFWSLSMVVDQGERLLFDYSYAHFSDSIFDILNHKGATVQLCLLEITPRSFQKDIAIPLKINNTNYCYFIREGDSFSFSGDNQGGDVKGRGFVRLVIIASNDPSEITLGRRVAR